MPFSAGEHVCIARRFLRPKAAATPLAPDSRDIVRDLVYLGVGQRDVEGEQRTVHLLKHVTVPDPLFSLQPPKPCADPLSQAAQDAAAPFLGASTGGGGAAAAAAQPEEEEEEVEADIDYDDDDLLIVPPSTFQLTPPLALEAVYEPWAHTPVNLVSDRSKIQAQLTSIAGLAEGFVTPAAIFLSLLPDPAITRLLAATNANGLQPPLGKDEFLGWLGILMVASDYAGPRQDLWTAGTNDLYPKPAVATVMSRRRFAPSPTPSA